MATQFSTTKDGHLAARVRHLTFALLPGRISPLAVFSCYPATEPANCEAGDFSSHDQVVADEAAFRAYVIDIAHHFDQVDQLARKELREVISTPWGPSQTRRLYADGVEFVTTESHGGFILDEAKNAVIDEEWRSRGGFYEEDEQWAIVAFHFPELFTTREKRMAEDTLKNWQPDVWMRLTGRTLSTSESFVLGQRAFRDANMANFVVISALRSKIHQGQVECQATVGGDRRLKPVTFLVPGSEYETGNFGFVIDEARHPRLGADGNPLPIAA